MVDCTLRPELVSLIHHVELDKAGWWDKAIQKLIVFAIWAEGGRLTQDRIQEVFEKDFCVRNDQIKLSEHISQLCQVGILIPLPGDEYNLSEQNRKEYEQDIAEGEELERNVKARFAKIFSECCPVLNVEQTWDVFHTGLLIPLIQEMGARTYELVSGSGPEVISTVSFQDFLHGYAASLHAPIRDAVIRYLDPHNTHIRSYVLRQLNSFFFLEAASLTRDTLDALVAMTKRKPTFKIMMDTNFVFSLLGVHENPSNEAAQALIDLVNRLSDTLEVKLYVLPPTIDETRRALATRIDPLKGWQLVPNLAAAALSSGLTGVARRYAEEVAKSGEALTADEYFDPYVNDLMTVLRSKGAEIYNQKTDNYNMRQDVIDDILHELEHEKKTRGERAKTYADLEHDMVLWHFVRDLRPRAVESPLGAQYWVTTVDYRFLGFDSYKRRQLGTSIPICLHPTALIQMLQFWVPRTEEFEAAVLGTMRLPFLFQDFDSDTERITTTILRTLSRFDKAGDLSVDTAHRVFVNKALRQKLSSEQSIERQIDLVREALVEADKARTAELRAAEKRAELHKTEAAKAVRLAEEAQERAGTSDANAIKAERELHKERKARELLERRLATVEGKLSETEIQTEIGREWSTMKLWIAWTLVAATSGTAVIGMLLHRMTGWQLAVVIPRVFSASLIPWICLVDWRAMQYKSLRGRTAFALLHRFKLFLLVLLSIAAAGVLQNAASSFVNHLWSNFRSALN